MESEKIVALFLVFLWNVALGTLLVLNGLIVHMATRIVLQPLMTVVVSAVVAVSCLLIMSVSLLDLYVYRHGLTSVVKMVGPPKFHKKTVKRGRSNE